MPLCWWTIRLDRALKLRLNVNAGMDVSVSAVYPMAKAMKWTWPGALGGTLVASAVLEQAWQQVRIGGVSGVAALLKQIHGILFRLFSFF